MTYVNESEIRARFSTLVLLHDGRQLRKGEFQVIRERCPECDRPVCTGEDVLFLRELKTCKLCINPDPLAWSKRTLVRGVWPRHVHACMDMCRLIDPRSEFFQNYNYRTGRITLRWLFDTTEAYLRIGPAAFAPDDLSEAEIRRLMQETIKLGPGTGGKRFTQPSSSSVSSTEDEQTKPRASGPSSSFPRTKPTSSKTMRLALT
jgi:hypothetical protein